MPPMIMVETSIGAGVTNPNLYTGSAFEFIRQRSVVSQGITAATTGSFANMQVGGRVLVEEFAPPVLARYPVIPDEMYFTDVGEVGDRLVTRVQNPTGGAIVHRAALQVS